ncbi:MAG: asparagine synthase (glutamine-hydrolyzing) [Gemmatimonadetes bacterium]|nr:asparagine synthase (glutamine-hydrolyzing) [Gemmatimonadota bacterium]|tara:strand:- start:23453 stop:25330 length:1878 start_codon:yes stop_codon:yes gene_type:complete
MCGIAGIYDRRARHIDRALLEKMANTVRHRGPDDSGLFLDKEIGFGHTRLSILDIEGGHQPMQSTCERYTIVYNGELYNYRELREDLKKSYAFRTQSDTEVVLAAFKTWGEKCMARFNGMFAFGIWDGVDRALFLARDHLGIKPLYYVESGDRFIFSSEIKAILAEGSVSPEVDPTSLDQFFTYRYVPSPRTMFRGIQKLRPGHYVKISARGNRTEFYWTRRQTRGAQNKNEAVEEVRRLLPEAVERQMLSDVPVAAFLSGGLDSSLVVALMSRASASRVQTFSVGFEGAESGENELPIAREVARHFGTDHQELTIRPGEYWRYLRKSAFDLEEPNGTSATLAQYFISRLAAMNVKVALSGQGADELFAGYRRYSGERLSGYYRRLPDILKQRLLPSLAERSGRISLIRATRSLLRTGQSDRLQSIYAVFPEEDKQSLYNDGFKQSIRGHEGSVSDSIDYWLGAAGAPSDPLEAMLYIDLRVWLPDELLTYGDKMCMATSLEMRVPLIDLDLVEAVEAMPIRVRVPNLTGKYVLKKAAEAYLPKRFVYRKKKGFPMPLLKWLSGDFGEEARNLILSQAGGCHRFLELEHIQYLFDYCRRVKDHRPLYCLLSFELWYRTFILGERF